ncbi:glycosyltransferase family 4 protein [Actinophytocola sp. NPDC049390]|uniref:glycosyltransferase family 4 protein n=1 Tax=Actinophytocola sp. NPDC049390 TaxID=3363894 RepID=UPI0037AEDF79
MPAILLISDEWTPTRGGISRFNRSLAIAFAEGGYRTACLVRAATDVERADAENHGVELFQAAVTPAGPDLSVRVSEVVAWRPDIVIGHELVSGSVAWTYTNHYVPTASLVYILHTVSLNEPYKSYPDTARRATNREREIEKTAAGAAVVAAVGPLLKRRGEAALGDSRVVQLVPGMDVPDDPRWLHRKPPPNSIVLMACRTNHIEAKGLDIAAGAIADLRLPRQLPPVELRIRGAHGDSCDSLKAELLGRVRVARHQIDVREYTADPTELARDLGQAALYVMPSRAEGFGLAALEAIGLGTPVLVSDRSGLADLLDDCLGEFAKAMIVPVVDDHERDVSTWRAAVEAKLQDLPRAFAYAHDVRKMLLPRLRWQTTVSTLMSRLPVPAPRTM